MLTLPGVDGMHGWDREARAAAGGIFGGGLEALTGGTPIGVAIVAALGAGLAIKFGGCGDRDD